MTNRFQVMTTFSCRPDFTPAAQRTLRICRRLAGDSLESDVWAGHLLLALLLDQSLASACLNRFGITQDWVGTGHLGSDVAQAAQRHSDLSHENSDESVVEIIVSPLEAINDPAEFTRVLDRAREICRRTRFDEGISSSSLLLAVVEISPHVRDALAASGATEANIRDALFPEGEQDDAPLPMDEVLEFNSSDLSAETEQPPRLEIFKDPALVRRILDVNLNRAREGLRVLEDAARFIADDPTLSLPLKTLRHKLVAAESFLQKHCLESSLLTSRDTENDVGTALTTPGEEARESVLDVVTSNVRRVQESLRSLEEFGKLISPDFAATMKQLRYQSYTIEKDLITVMHRSRTSPTSNHDGTLHLTADSAATDRTAKLRRAAVYVLITESACRLHWQIVVEQALAGGADVLQLREKTLNDRELIRRARWIQQACRAANALFIVNDRPDIAAVSDADGVHVGQEEFSVAETRRVLDRGQLVGVSTHSIDQFQQAIVEQADYLGVGPVFPSHTKSFAEFPGLPFVRAAAAVPSPPWFAIGGVTMDTLTDLKQSGAQRIAVTSAVTRSEDPAQAVQELRRHLMSPDAPNSD
jgi:thiamine-phosphate pyrophosphorylase